MFAVNQNRCVASCNTLDDLSDRVCVSNRTDDINLCFFHMITELNESNILNKYIPCKCDYIFDGRKCNPNQKWNNDKFWCKCKNPKKHSVCKKDFIWNPATCR